MIGVVKAYHQVPRSLLSPETFRYQRNIEGV
jgi:hypothetical protein